MWGSTEGDSGPTVTVSSFDGPERRPGNGGRLTLGDTGKLTLADPGDVAFADTIELKGKAVYKPGVATNGTPSLDRWDNKVRRWFMFSVELVQRACSPVMYDCVLCHLGTDPVAKY